MIINEDSKLKCVIASVIHVSCCSYIAKTIDVEVFE